MQYHGLWFLPTLGKVQKHMQLFVLALCIVDYILRVAQRKLSAKRSCDTLPTLILPNDVQILEETKVHYSKEVLRNTFGIPINPVGHVKYQNSTFSRSILQLCPALVGILA